MAATNTILVVGVVCLLANICLTTAVSLDDVDISAETWLQLLEDPQISNETKAMIEKKLEEYGVISYKHRNKRQIAGPSGDGDHWCCKRLIAKDDIIVYHVEIASRIATKETYTRDCGFWGGCDTKRVQSTFVEYFTYEQPTNYTVIDMGFEPCEIELLTCCAQYHYFRPLDECTIIDDWLRLAQVFEQFPYSFLWLYKDVPSLL